MNRLKAFSQTLRLLLVGAAALCCLWLFKPVPAARTPVARVAPVPQRDASPAFRGGTALFSAEEPATPSFPTGAVQVAATGTGSPTQATAAPPVRSAAPILPAYLKRARPTQLNVSALPTRTERPGRQDRLELFGDVAPTVKWTKLSDNGSRNYAWFGSLIEDRLSAVTLTRLDDYTIVDIRSPKFGDYEVLGQDGMPAQVRQFDSDKINKGCKESVLMGAFGSNADAAEMEMAAAEPAAATVAAFTAKTVDVLMVYTARARELAGSRAAIAARCQSAVNGENNNFDRSQIVHNVRLVGAREINHTASGSLPNELNYVAGNSTVASLRSETGADLVAIASDKDDAGIAGVAHLPGAFSAIYSELLGGVWPHEAGHNFGCQHNSAGVYSYASGHYWNDPEDNKQYGSVMSYIGSRIPYFSNPDVNYHGSRTGTPSRNNALCVNNRGDDAAAYKGSKTLVEPSCTVTLSKTKPLVDTEFTVTIKTVNGGPATMSAAQIGITLPSRVTLVSSSGGGTFNTTSKVWSVPSLVDNASASLVLTLKPTATATGVSQTVSAKVNTLGAGVVDYNVYNNSGSATFVAVPFATSGPVLHYTLDEASGQTATDSESSYGAQNAVTSYATPQWKPDGGMIGGALQLTPTAQADVAQAFSCNSSTPLITDYPFTMALWLKTGTSAWYEVCSMLGDPTTGGAYFDLSVSNSKVNATARNATSYYATSPATVSDNQWHHVAAVFNSATSRTLYLDGAAVATSTTSVAFVTNNTRFSIGALMRDAPTQSFPGMLDDIGLWSTALTKEHIAIIHAMGRYSQVDLDHPSIDLLVAGGLTAGTTATAGDYTWTPTTGLSGAVGTSGFLGSQPYLVLNTSGGGLIGKPYVVTNPQPFWFDQNGPDADFGVAANGTYNWLADSTWTSAIDGADPFTAWTAGNDAFLIGAGADTSYTVRLGSAGTTAVLLRNMFLNCDGADPAAPLGAGNVAIGNSGDSGELRLSAESSIGSTGGELTINAPLNLGNDQDVFFRGGAVKIAGLISGSGSSGVSLAVGGTFLEELAQGTLILSNVANSYTGPTTIDAGYTLEVAKLANGGSPSSIGASSNGATNLVFNGGTLCYSGGTASTDRKFTLSPDTTSTIDVSAPSAVLTLSGSTVATNGALIKRGAGTLLLSGTNLHDGATTIGEGTLSIATSANLGNGNGLVFDGGTLQVTGTALTSLAGHTVAFASGGNVGFDIVAAGNTFTIGEVLNQGNGALIKSGAGILALTNSNTYTGPTLLNGGVLSVSSVGALGATSSVTVANTARLNFNQPSVQGPSNPTVYNAPVAITGNGGNVSAGALRFWSPSNRSNYTLTGLITLNGTGFDAIVSYNAGLNFANLLGGITGPGSLEIQAGGANAGHAHVFTLAGVLDYTGATRFDTVAASGRVVLSNTTLPSGTVLSLGAQINVGTNVIEFDLNGNSQTLAGLQTVAFNGAAMGKNQVINTSATKAILTVNNSGADYTFAGNLGANGQAPIGGTGGAGNNFSLVKTGSGTLTLSGVNTYAGETTVKAGTLAMTGSSIADANQLVIDGGKVQASGGEVVEKLFFGASQQASGSWGASGSGADHIDNIRFAGTGVLNVTTGPGVGFASWVAGFGVAAAEQGPNADPDGDGISNLLEYVLGGNPALNDAGLRAPLGARVGSNYIFTFKRSDLSEADAPVVVEYGNDLTVWGSFAIGASPGSSPVVIQEDTPDPALDTVTVTIPTGGAPRFFVRLKATAP